MIKRTRFPRIFFGWWTVLGGGFLTAWGLSFTSTGMSALFKPIAKELGFSRAVTSVAASVSALEGGFAGPIAGWVMDRYGPRVVALLGVFLIGLGLILMKFVNSLWAYYIVYGLIIGTGSHIGMGVTIDKAVTNWFVKKRGVAQGVRYVLTGLGPVLGLPLVVWLIITQGWRMAVFIGGVVMWLVGLPLVWFCVKPHRPEYYGLLPDGATVEGESAETSQMIDRGVKYAAEVEEVEFTLRQAMRTPTYWLLFLSNVAWGMVAPALFIHMIPFLTDIGIEPLRAAGIIAMMNAFGLPARFASGIIADRIRTGHLRFLLGGTYLLQAVGITVFLLNQSMSMVYVWLFLHYVAMSAGFALPSIIRARYFGRKAFGSIQGSSAMLMTPVGVIAPIYAGWIYDTTGSYITAFTVFAALLASAAVIMSLNRPPKPPAQVTDVHKIV